MLSPPSPQRSPAKSGTSLSHPLRTVHTTRSRPSSSSQPPHPRNVQQLIGGEELGDRNPTQLLRRMQQLLGDHLPFLKELFLQRLPANVLMVLASADPSTALPQLAEMADKIIEVATPPIVAATSTPASEVQQLREEVTRLAELVAPIADGQRPQRGRSRSRSRRPPSPARADSQTPAEPCWYHKKFGESAKKCQQPCNWSGNE